MTTLLRMTEKKQLDSVFLTYNLTTTVTFPTSSQGISSTVIDNIFLDNSKISNHAVLPFLNSLSDHDTQLLILKDLNLQLQDHYTYTTRYINK